MSKPIFWGKNETKDIISLLSAVFAHTELKAKLMYRFCRKDQLGGGFDWQIYGTYRRPNGRDAKGLRDSGVKESKSTLFMVICAKQTLFKATSDCIVWRCLDREVFKNVFLTKKKKAGQYFTSRKHAYIVFTPFYIAKLGFIGVDIIFLISAQKHGLWVLVRAALARRF